MKRIAVFCDGTWNSPTRDAGHQTHARQLSLAVENNADQVTRYFEGVGTGGKVNTFVTNTINKIGGGAFGWGLRGKIVEAYEFIARNYDPGDEILIFGFSRGAYTARSIAGMIRKCGLLDRISRANLRRAYRLYKQGGPENRPDAGHILKARQKLSPRFATSQRDLDARGNDGSFLVRISYLGIWDTVGALGIPEPVFGPLARLWNSRYRFHDTDLSGMVQTARHALALDERRKMFEPTLWRNLDVTRDARGRVIGDGLNNGDTGPDRAYQQVWFVGDHGMVGGSGSTRGLTAITLEWLARGATGTGLTMRPGFQLLDVPPDPLDPGPEQQDNDLFETLAPELMAWRTDPKASHDIHPTVPVRVAGIVGYDPPSLR